MNYIVLDMEWNQNPQVDEQLKKQLVFEVIEIGAIKLSEDKTMIGEFSELIKPQVFHEMHRITSRLIHLQMQELEAGRSFPEVAGDFIEWCGEEVTFCSWGCQDLSELQKNMEYYHMPPLGEGPIAFYDVQKLFSLAYEDGKSRKSLEYAVDFLGIEKDIPFHRAFSDAYYTAKVFARLRDEKVLQYVSYDTYRAPRTKEQEVQVVFDTYAKYISREFDNKIQLMADKEVISTRCYLCNKAARKKIRWFSANGKNYFCAAYCEQHGYLRAKLRIRKDCNRKLYAVKTTKHIDEAGYAAVQERFLKVKEMKKRRSK